MCSARLSSMSPSAPDKPVRRPAGRPSSSAITREALLEVALNQLDRVGPHAFSVRDVARSLGVYPSTIYWHVESKEALLAEVAGLVMTGAIPPRGSGDWKTWIRNLFKLYRKAVLKHPNVAQLVGAQLVSNASLSLDLIEGVIGVLLEAGATEENLREAYNCVISSLAGFMTMELAPMPVENPEGWATALEGRVRAIDPLEHPTLTRHIHLLANRAFILRWQNGSQVPLTSSFNAHVEIFLAGLEVFLARGKSPAVG
ncbi:TetR/AcrR family tetracycline transcriptional repressor [Ottowia thiooxydans]|uniref:TetR/AcrR family tetracycline transcriptional repressor n=2 Tax=Ottowia thiooxydans TaxID=219182 RepID=A0ABV2Q6Z7_9BURK